LNIHTSNSVALLISAYFQQLSADEIGAGSIVFLEKERFSVLREDFLGRLRESLLWRFLTYSESR
jgi:hypothetical protein